MSIQMLSARISLLADTYKPDEKLAKNRTPFENMVIFGGSAIALLLIVWAFLLNTSTGTDNTALITLGIVVFTLFPVFVLTLIVMFLDTQFNNDSYKSDN